MRTIEKTGARRCPGRLWLAAALCCALAFTAWGIQPKQDETSLSSKEFFQPELYLPISHQPLAAVIDQLPNQAAWQSFDLAAKAAGRDKPVVWVDPRSATTTNMILAVPLIPGDGAGNDLTLDDLRDRLGDKMAGAAADGAGRDGVLAAVRRYVGENRDLLGIDESQVGEGVAGQANPHLWHVAFPQTFRGVPVRYGRVVATLSHGNLVTIGTETWANVRGTSTVPQLSADEALDSGFAFAGGRTTLDVVTEEPVLEIVPMATSASEIGQGFRHVLTWTYEFVRHGEGAVWRVTVDAQSGDVLAFEDQNQYLEGHITGGVYPITSTEICPTNGTCGVMQSGWPMPFADTGLAPPDNFTDSAGRLSVAGDITTTLSGRFVNISDSCGPIVDGGTAGTLDLGGVNGDHDCTVPAGTSAGNTPASRTAFYELNKLIEMAQGWLPGNPWIQGQITANVNLNNTCNAFWNGSTINFYRSGGGCRNTGELAGVFDHEWGHGLDDNDTLGSLSNTSEAYADIVGIYRLHDSCVGHGFFETVDDGCGMTADGTGFNADENQASAVPHCDLDCSGVRDADWDRHADHNPDTPLNFVCPSCNSSSGPCGRQVHCSAAPVRQAAWDLVTRDLPFDRQTNFVIGNRLFYQGSGSIGTWYSCSCTGGTSDGCGSASGYMQWLAADDDNGNLNDGTPNMAAIFAAFDRHEIACATPTPQNGGCAGGPSTAPAVAAVAGPGQVDLTWNSIAGATEYWVMRTEGHAGCDFGKARIAQTAGLSFTDTEVAAGRDYHYTIVAASSETCHSPLSNCATATPTAPPPPPPPPPPPECTTLFYSTDFEADDGGFVDGASTCTTGTFIRGTPDLVTSSGVQTQPGGAAGGTFAWFTQNNTGGAGVDDVDGGTCETLSPVIAIGAGNTLAAFVDYFHGQRDGGGDPADGFTIDVIDADTGAVFLNLVSFGDVSNNALWTSVARSADGSPANVRLRVRATDSPASGDLVEGGIDNVQICTESGGDPCVDDTDCDNGLFCDGAEVCVAGSCQAGPAPDCDDGVSCTNDACNEATDACDNVADDANCDNGLFCDGAETCDAVLDCQAGTPVNCDDGVGCTVDSCDEAADACDNAPDDGACDNGLFCDGAETCDPALDCQPGSDPCPGGTCDEATDSCLGCGDGVCGLGEDCTSCPADCPAFPIPGSSCGNGLCEAGDGETCFSCPADCAGQTGGKPANRFCCGFGDGLAPDGCGDTACNSGGSACTEVPAGGGGSTCCGDAVCESTEDAASCAIDCDTCGNGVCDPNEDSCTCAVDCGVPPATEVGFCGDSADNDCDGLIDCGDVDDCATDGACVCTAGQPGDACSVDDDCCSGQCKGNGTCK